MGVDTSSLEGLLNFDKEIKKACKQAEDEIAQMAKAKAVELANASLHSRRNLFLEHLHLDVVDGVHVLTLDAEVRWIDDGAPARNILADLLASPKAKTAPDGSKYLVVPFDHNKRPQDTPASSGPIVAALRQELKQRKIPFRKIERDSSGRPIVGVVHKFNVDAPNKTAIGPGQGHGPLGGPRQGPSGVPFLHGVNVSQHQDANGKVSKSIMTYRVASSKQGSNMWNVPESAPTHIMDQTYEWCQQQIERYTQQIITQALSRI